MGFDESGEDLEGTAKKLSMDLDDGTPTGLSHCLMLTFRSSVVL
jgi:hypothetical protein